MPLTDKYLKYSPEITLEILTLVQDKLKLCGMNSLSAKENYKYFKNGYEYLVETQKNFFYTRKKNSPDLLNKSETTVQEILGYDPFIKDDFVLPGKWYVRVTKENYSVLNNWRVNVIKYSENNFDVAYQIMLQDGSGGFVKGHENVTEITFEQFKKYVLKESIEEPKVESKEVIPEYVECIEGAYGLIVGCIYKIDEKGFIIGGIGETHYSTLFVKPSTKEAFDAQNQPKSVNNNGFFVALQNKLISHTSAEITTGKIYKADSRNEFNDDRNNWIFFTNNEKNIKWFTTKSEAEEFAKTLVEPVKHSNGVLNNVEYKQPLKQAVHCTTQEEWDFACKKHKANMRWNEKYPILVLVNYDWSISIDFDDKGDFQILSFQEWCDLNGYKMESKCDFIVGKWYKMNDFWYLKYKGKDIINTDKIYMSEIIDSTFIHKYDNGFVAYLYEQKTWREASIKEIQQYLPDGHPDKITPIIQQAKDIQSEFKVGDWVIRILDLGGPHSKGRILQISSIYYDQFIPVGFEKEKHKFTSVRHATPEEINNHLISIGQIPAGEPLNTGIKPNKDGVFKYTTYFGTTHVGKTSTISGPLKMTLSIDDEELPIVNIIKTNTVKQLLNND